MHVHRPAMHGEQTRGANSRSKHARAVKPCMAGGGLTLMHVHCPAMHGLRCEPSGHAWLEAGVH